MNKLLKYILLAAVIFFTPLYSYSQINLMGKSIDDYIAECMNRWQIPGMSVAVIEDGKVTYIKGYGVKELGKNDNVDENTLFAVASNTKAFIGTSIALLENDGKIKLDDKVQKYIPDIKLNITELSSMLSIKDILTHRIGIGTFHGDFITWGTNFTTPQLITNLQNVKPVYDFRSGYGYFNMGYVVAGEVIKVITGQKWDEFVGTNILTPLGMKRTITSITRLGEFDNIAAPHSFNYDYKMTPIPWRNVDNIGPCGGIISSASDMAKWVTMQINEGKFEGKEIIPRKVILRTHTPFNLIPAPSHGTGNLSNRHFRTYGLGWGIADYKGELFLEHSGGYDGMLSRTAFMPDKKFGLVILTNNDQNDVITSLMYQLFDYAIGKESFNWDSLVFANETSNGVPYDKIAWDEILGKTDPNLKSSFEMSSLEGMYSNEQAGLMRIRIIGNSPQFRLSSRPGVTGILSHWRNDTLICQFSDFLLGRCLAAVTTENGKIYSIKIKATDFIDPLYYEYIRKE